MPQVEDPPLQSAAIYRPVPWRALPGWRRDDHSAALIAFLKSCEAMREDQRWQQVCEDAKAVPATDGVEARLFFEGRFKPYEVIAANRQKEGLITGYYLPVLKGSRTPSVRFAHPVYRKPGDLVRVDPALVGSDRARPFRGRLTPEGRVVPYYSRAQIDGPQKPLAGEEIVWVDDPIGLFFLHIQGSGFVQLEDGSMIQVAYAGQNGHGYYPIGRYLIEQGYIPREEISMQSIRAWLKAHPDRMQEVFNTNASYIFLEEKPFDAGVIGSQGVPLSEQRSVAVDPGFIDLGTPVYVSTPHPRGFRTIRRLTIAQDTGGAIRGAVRADFFWGKGAQAGHYAGRMKGHGRLWVLLPHSPETKETRYAR
jgi:membrane-bound lytic murein transglycosylase A